MKISIILFCFVIVVLPAHLSAKEKGKEAEKMIAEGKALLKNKSVDEALEKFKLAIELDPNNPEAYYQMGIIHINTNQFEKGVMNILKSIELAPDNLRLRFILADLYEKKGLLNKATEEYKKIKSLAPEGRFAIEANKKLKLVEGLAIARKKDYKEALKVFNEILLTNPDDLTALFNIGLAELKLKRIKEAKNTFEKIIDLQPKHIRAYLKLGEIYAILKQPPKAIKQFQKVIQLAPKSREAQQAKIKMALTKGISLLQKGDLVNSIKKFQSVLKIHPENPVAHFNIGVIYLQQKQLDKAEKKFIKVIEISPENLAARLNLGMLYVQNNKPDSAIKEFESLLSMDKDGIFGKNAAGRLSVLYFLKGEFFLKRNSSKEALVNFEKVTELAPNHLNAHFNSGLLLLRQQKFEEAKKKFEEVLRIDPKNLLGHLNLGLIHENLKSFSDASKEYKQVTSLKKDSKEAKEALEKLKFLKGKEYLEKKQFDLAEKEFNKVKDKEPNNILAHFFLATAYLRKNDLQKAKSSFQKANELDPKHIGSLYYLGLILEQQNFEEQALTKYLEITSKTQSGPIVENVKNRIMAIQRKLKGFFFNLDYNMAYSDNSNLSETNPSDDYISNLSANLSYRQKLREKIKIGAIVAPSFSSYHISQFDLFNTNMTTFVTYGPPNINITGGYTFQTAFTNDQKTSNSNNFFVNGVMRRKRPTSLRVSLNYRDFKTTANTIFNAKTYTANFSVTQILKWNIVGTLGYAFTFNKSDLANDYKYKSHGVNIRFEKALLPKLNGSLGYSYTLTKYENPDSFSGFETKRENNTQSVSGRLSYRLHKNISFILSYSWLRNVSNLPIGFIFTTEQLVSGLQSSSLGSFERQTFTAGLNWNF